MELKEEPTPPHRARCINECAYMRGKKNTRRHTSNDNKKKGSELSWAELLHQHKRRRRRRTMGTTTQANPPAPPPYKYIHLYVEQHHHHHHHILPPLFSIRCPLYIFYWLTGGRRNKRKTPSQQQQQQPVSVHWTALLDLIHSFFSHLFSRSLAMKTKKKKGLPAAGEKERRKLFAEWWHVGIEMRKWWGNDFTEESFSFFLFFWFY